MHTEQKAWSNWSLRQQKVLLWGPFLWGPLFGRTRCTCLNPPLFAQLCGVERTTNFCEHDVGFLTSFPLEGREERLCMAVFLSVLSHILKITVQTLRNFMYTKL